MLLLYQQLFYFAFCFVTNYADFNHRWPDSIIWRWDSWCWQTVNLCFPIPTVWLPQVATFHSLQIRETYLHGKKMSTCMVYCNDWYNLVTSTAHLGQRQHKWMVCNYCAQKQLSFVRLHASDTLLGQRHRLLKFSIDK